MDPQTLLALCHEHARAEGDLAMERVLGTLVPEPRFEFFPLRRTIAGRANIERFYREQYPRFAPSVAGFEVLGEWTNDIAAVQEYTVDVSGDDGATTTYHVISMMLGDDATGLLAGERLYCDDGFVRALLGPLYELLEPTP